MATVDIGVGRWRPIAAQNSWTNSAVATILDDGGSNDILFRIPAETARLGEAYRIEALLELTATNGSDTFALDYFVVDNATTPNSTDYLDRAAFNGSNDDFHKLDAIAYFTAVDMGANTCTLTITGTLTGVEVGSVVAVTFNSAPTNLEPQTAIDFGIELTMSNADAGNIVFLRYFNVQKVSLGGPIAMAAS